MSPPPLTSMTDPVCVAILAPKRLIDLAGGAVSGGRGKFPNRVPEEFSARSAVKSRYQAFPLTV
jgi:hypothetical protein